MSGAVRFPTLCSAALGLALVACARPTLTVPAPSVPLLRLGPERTRIPYDDPRAEDKRVLFEKINADRAAAGAPLLQYESRAARVGDAFCLAAAASGTVGHWDLQGRAPYLRWGLAGGVDYEAENLSTVSSSSGSLPRPVLDLMLEGHASMMAERPPHDGHRRTILDPTFTHVGIGVAAVGGEFRMTEEFTRVAFEWIEIPARPLRAGGAGVFAGRPLPGLDLGVVEIRFEPPPQPLSREGLRRRGGYGYPPLIRSLWPRLPHGYRYAVGLEGDFKPRSDGSFTVRFPLDRGPGHYFVLAYLRPPDWHGPMRPATAAMITALP